MSVTLSERLRHITKVENNGNFAAKVIASVINDGADEINRLKALNDELLAALEYYVNYYPAFRIKPVGALGSEARLEQDQNIALEDKAKALITKAKEARNAE